MRPEKLYLTDIVEAADARRRPARSGAGDGGPAGTT